MKRCCFFVGLLLAIPVSAQQIDSNIFLYKDAGIQISKPANWEFMSLDDYLEQKKKVDRKSKNFNDRVRMMKNIPVVTVVKKPEADEKVYTCVEFSIKDISQLSDKDEIQVMDHLIMQFKKVLKDFTILNKTHIVMISGVKASELELSYTFTPAKNMSAKCHSRIIVWKKGCFLYQLALSYDAKPNPKSVEGLKQIVDNVKLF